MLHCIVFANMIHGAHLGVRSLCCTTRCPSLQLSPHLLLSYLSLPLLITLCFMPFYFSLFFSTVPFSPKGAIVLQHVMALSLSYLNSSIYQILLFFFPSLLLSAGFPHYFSHVIKHSTSALSSENYLNFFFK